MKIWVNTETHTQIHTHKYTQQSQMNVINNILNKHSVITSPSAPPGNTGRSKLKSIPPNVIASIKLENTSPVGSDVVPLTFMREGTHMNTTRS